MSLNKVTASGNLGADAVKWEVRVDDIELMQYRRERQQAAPASHADVYGEGMPFQKGA